MQPRTGVLMRALAAIVVAQAVLASAQDRPAATTWAGLSAGPHGVGFSVVAVPGGPQQPSPARIFVWRPVKSSGTAMTLRNFVQAACPGATIPADCFPNLTPAEPGPDANRPAPGPLEELPLHAMLGGDPAAGRYPLVVLLGSIASRGGEFVGLAEALASRGYVVAEVVAAPRPTARAFDQEAVDDAVGTATRVVAQMSQDAGVDSTRMGLVAWSFGGVAAALTAAREPRVQALVSLDSALRYKYGADLLRGASFRPELFRAHLLSIAAGIDNPVEKDEALIGAMPGTVVERMTGDGLAHGDFCDQYGALAARLRPADARAAFHARYRTVGEGTIAFLDRALHPQVPRRLVEP